MSHDERHRRREDPEKHLPAVRESIEQKDWKLAEEQIVRVGKVLENTGEAIQGATAELSRTAR